MPGKAWERQIPGFLRSNDGIFEDEFIEHRRQGLEEFINKYVRKFLSNEYIYFLSRVAGHPLAQNERSLHVFLQEEKIDYDKYVPGKVRNG